MLTSWQNKNQEYQLVKKLSRIRCYYFKYLDIIMYLHGKIKIWWNLINDITQQLIVQFLF